MKICDLTQFYSPVSGGVKRYISEKRRYLQTHTSDEHILIIPGSTNSVSHEGRLHQYTIQSPRVDRTSRYRILFDTRMVFDILDDIRPDIIESGDPYHLAWTALNAGRDLHIPVVGFYHSHFPEAYLRTALKYGGRWLRNRVMGYAQKYIIHLYSQFQKTIVPSEHLRDLLDNWGIKNAVTLHLGVDTESFQPGIKDDFLQSDLGIPSDKKILLYVGRLSGEKNVTTLFKAFRLLVENEKKPYHLIVIGDGPFRSEVEALSEQTGAVSWISYINNNRTLARYYRTADLFVHPGVCETFGLVSLESQACGCPVAGIRGSYMDANIFETLPLWAKENTPRALAEAIERVAALDRKSAGLAAAEKVRDNYSWPIVFSKLWQIYRDASAA